MPTADSKPRPPDGRPSGQSGPQRSVAIVSALNPYPRRSGKSVVLGGIVDYWVDRLGADNVHYLLVDSDEPDPAAFAGPVVRVAPPTRGERLRSVLTLPVVGRASIQESIFRGASLRRALQGVLEQLAPDLVLFDTVRLGQYARLLPRPDGQRRVIYLDDLFSERYRTMLDAAARHPDATFDALGNFSRYVPGPLRGVVNHRSVQRMLLRRESALVRRSEDRAAREFDRALLVNGEEAKVLAARSGSDRVRTSPPLVSLPAGGPRRWDGTPTFVCLGDWVLPHNDDGLRWFLNHCMAEVARRVREIRLRVIGPGAREELRALVPAFPGVALEGYVDDLDEALSSAAALLAPIRFGSGIKIKILEAGARGLPVITTGVGAHGIGAGPDEGLLVADTSTELVGAVVSACDPEENRRLSRAAREHYAETFATDVVMAAYDEVFSPVATPAAGGVGAGPARPSPGSPQPRPA